MIEQASSSHTLQLARATDERLGNDLKWCLASIMAAAAVSSLQSRRGAKVGGSLAATVNPILATRSESILLGGAGGFGTAAANAATAKAAPIAAIAFAGKMKHAIHKVEQAAIVVSRARALEHVEHNHPRIPGSVHTVKVLEPIYKRDEERGTLIKVSSLQTGMKPPRGRCRHFPPTHLIMIFDSGCVLDLLPFFTERSRGFVSMGSHASAAMAIGRAVLFWLLK